MAGNKDLKITSLTEDNLVEYVINKIQIAASEAIAAHGIFVLGVSGGSIINFLCGDTGLPTIKTDWTRWKIFLCDERIVPESDPESTGGLYKKLLLPKLPVFPVENFLAAEVSLPSSQEVATNYELKLKSCWTDPSSNNFGAADCLLLGLGPDGHTCSLFPDHKALDVTDSWITFVEDSPKPPPKRITLTYSFINNAANILVVGIGEQKFEIAKRIQNGEDFPIGRVSNTGGHLEWILGSK